jgi:hypothetical protein
MLLGDEILIVGVGFEKRGLVFEGGGNVAKLFCV